MGSSAAYHLARRGLSVLGLDRFTPPHTMGSSHGETRIIREAYAEHLAYVPIVQRAYELWDELEDSVGRRLFLQTGGLTIGPPDAERVVGAEYSARHFRLSYQRLTAHEVSQRHSALSPTDDMIAIWDPRAGILFPEACIEAQLEMARRSGATLRFDEPAVSWTADGAGVNVVTPTDVYHGGRLILTAGAWTSSLIPDLPLPLTVERQVLFWFAPTGDPQRFSPERCPVFIWDWEPDRRYYGFPDLGRGVKVSLRSRSEAVDPDGLRRQVTPEDADPVREFLRRFMPEANGAQLAAEVCMFTNTPDSHFLIDHHPAYPQVLIASPCSGSGFKFASAIGEILADLAAEGRSSFDLSLFSLERFLEPAAGKPAQVP